MVKYLKGKREQSEDFEGNTGTQTPPPWETLIERHKHKHKNIFVYALASKMLE